MSENIIIQPNKPLFVKLSDPMNTENFNFETREGKFLTSTGQTLTLPRPAVLRLYVLEPAPGEELEILKKWSGKRGEPAIWSVRRAQETASAPAEATCSQCGARYSPKWDGTTCTRCDGTIGIHAQETASAPAEATCSQCGARYSPKWDGTTCTRCDGTIGIHAQETASAPAEAAAPESPSAVGETAQEAPTPIRRPSRRPATRERQPGLFDGRHQPTCNAVLLPGEASCNCINGAPFRKPGEMPVLNIGTGTYGPAPMPAGVAYAAPRPSLVPRRPAGEVIPWNVAFREVSQWVNQELRGNRLQWSDEAQQAMVCTVLIAEAKKGRIGPWER